MTDHTASPLTPPTEEERAGIELLTEQVSSICNGQPADLVMGALATIILNFAAGAPPEARVELRANIDVIVEMLEAMGDAVEFDEAIERAQSVYPGQTWTGTGSRTH